MSDQPAVRPLTVVVWMLVFAVGLIGVYKLLHLDHRSADQKILIEKSGK